MADNKASFLWAIKQQESGGNYSIKNPSSGALGAYQVMPSNVAVWTSQALGRSLTPSQFLADPAAQDQVANVILGGYYDQYGADGAASMWYSGQPNPDKPDPGDSPTIREYVDQVVSRMSSSPPVSGTSPASWYDPLGVGKELSQGLEQGLLSAFKATMGPVLSWGFWLFETFVGIGLAMFGMFIIAQKSDVVKTVEGTVLKSSPEAAPMAKKIETPPAPKRIETPQPPPLPKTRRVIESKPQRLERRAAEQNKRELARYAKNRPILSKSERRG